MQKRRSTGIERLKRKYAYLFLAPFIFGIVVFVIVSARAVPAVFRFGCENDARGAENELCGSEVLPLSVCGGRTLS